MFRRKVISLDLAKQLTVSTNKKIKPGYKLCPRSQSQQGKDTKSIEEGEIDSSATSSTRKTTESESMDSVKRISFAVNAKKKTEVLLLSESHQSTYTTYQKNIDYLTAAKKLKLPQNHWRHLSLMILVLS